MERLTTAGTTSSTPHVVHAVKESSSVSERDKVPKFRKLEVEEDVDSYLGAYEAHMDSYSVPRTQWSKHLAPILNPDATEVYMAMESEDRKNYDSLKEALYAHYNMNKETYRRKMEQLRRKLGESWTVCGKRYKSLVRKWISGCETVEDIVELLAVDAITRLMPRPVANHVKDRSPTALAEATKLADDFIRNRGWNYDQLEALKQNHDGSTKKYIQRNKKPPIPAQSANSQTVKINSEGKISDHPAPKKKIDPKLFDPEKGAQCFFCHEWGHKSRECPKKVCAVASAEDKFERRVNEWHTVQGVLGVHSCEIGLDSGAEMTVVAADLVPTSAFTGERKRIAGVHSIGKEVPLATLRLTIGPRRLQVTAAVLDRPPHDVLLGRDCQELPELLEEALSQKKLRDQETVAVVTRKQARIEN